MLASSENGHRSSENNLYITEKVSVTEAWKIQAVERGSSP